MSKQSARRRTKREALPGYPSSVKSTGSPFSDAVRPVARFFELARAHAFAEAGEGVAKLDVLQRGESIIVVFAEDTAVFTAAGYARASADGKQFQPYDSAKLEAGMDRSSLDDRIYQFMRTGEVEVNGQRLEARNYALSVANIAKGMGLDSERNVRAACLRLADSGKLARVPRTRGLNQPERFELSWSSEPKDEASLQEFETIPNGTHVTWHSRGAIGHGTVVGVHKKGKTAGETEYTVRQHDHFKGEPDTLHYYGHSLHRAESGHDGGCGVCNGRGQVYNKIEKRWVPCLACDGTGHSRGVTQPPAVGDTYTGHGLPDRKGEAAHKFHVGDRVGWHYEGGTTSGKITHVHTKDFEVAGHTQHASPDDPQYEIQSDHGTDHVAYHYGKTLHKLGEAAANPAPDPSGATDEKVMPGAGNNDGSGTNRVAAEGTDQSGFERSDPAFNGWPSVVDIMPDGGSVAVVFDGEDYGGEHLPWRVLVYDPSNDFDDNRSRDFANPADAFAYAKDELQVELYPDDEEKLTAAAARLRESVTGDSITFRLEIPEPEADLMVDEMMEEGLPVVSYVWPQLEISSEAGVNACDELFRKYGNKFVGAIIEADAVPHGVEDLIDRDYHALNSSEVARLIAAADADGYRKPANANGSRGRYYHAMLRRRAAKREADDGEGALKYVKKQDGHWWLVSKHTGRHLKDFGTEKPSREAAAKALRDVEYYKHHGESKFRVQREAYMEQLRVMSEQLDGEALEHFASELELRGGVDAQVHDGEITIPCADTGEFEFAQNFIDELADEYDYQPLWWFDGDDGEGTIHLTVGPAEEVPALAEATPAQATASTTPAWYQVMGGKAVGQGFTSYQAAQTGRQDAAATLQYGTVNPDGTLAPVAQPAA